MVQISCGSASTGFTRLPSPKFANGFHIKLCSADCVVLNQYSIEYAKRSKQRLLSKRICQYEYEYRDACRRKKRRSQYIAVLKACGPSPLPPVVCVLVIVDLAGSIVWRLRKHESSAFFFMPRTGKEGVSLLFSSHFPFSRT